MRALAIQHFAAGGLGNVRAVLTERGYDVTIVDATADSVAAASREPWDLVIVLGSEDAVYEDHGYVAPEIELVRERLQRSAPTLGICFGAQIMAAALGGSVHRGASGSEIGFVVVDPSAAGSTSPLRHIAGVPVCQWHGDTFVLPPSVTSLASTERYGNQAFALGDTALAVQFHPEITHEMFDRWVDDGLEDLAAEGIEAGELRAQGLAHIDAATVASRLLFGEFLDGLPHGDGDTGPGSDTGTGSDTGADQG